MCNFSRYAVSFNTENKAFIQSLQVLVGHSLPIVLTALQALEFHQIVAGRFLVKIRSDCAALGVRVARSAWEISRNYGSQSLENTLKGVHCTMRRVCFRKIFTRRCDPPARQTQFHLPSQPRCHAVYLQGGAFVSGSGLVRAVFYTIVVQFSDMTADLLAPSFPTQHPR